VVNDATWLSRFVSLPANARGCPSVDRYNVTVQPAVGAQGAMQWTFTGVGVRWANRCDQVKVAQ
jgi:hypothetical protein